MADRKRQVAFLDYATTVLHWVAIFMLISTVVGLGHFIYMVWSFEQIRQAIPPACH